MSRETIVIEGVLKSLEGLKTIMDATDDTGPNAELGSAIQDAIDAAVCVILGDCDEEEEERGVSIDVSKAAAIKTISWADYGWHTLYIGDDEVRYTWL